jgi:hypothetical protein
MTDHAQEIIAGLDPTIQESIQKVISTCLEQGLMIVPYCGYRSVLDEMKLWRQSRSTDEIEQQIDKLQTANCTYLADLLQQAGAQNGPHVTNTIGGFSWHNWKQAVDCYVQGDDGNPIWDASNPGYQTYGDIAKSLGYTWGGDFTTFKDATHIQFNAGEIDNLYSIKQVNDIFQSNGW